MASEFPTPESALAFWASLDERSRLMLAKEAPRVAGRWELRGRMWHRTLKSGQCFLGAETGDGGLFWGCVERQVLPFKPPFAAAQSACDAKLRELGYVLEDGE